MNGVPEVFEYKVKQSASGVWSCDRITVSDKSMAVVSSKLDLAMTDVEQVLFKHNHHEEQPEKKED